MSTAINQVVSDIKKSISNNNDKSSKNHIGDLCSPGLKEWEVQVWNMGVWEWKFDVAIEYYYIQVVELLLKYITDVIHKISLPLHESEADFTDKQ